MEGAAGAVVVVIGVAVVAVAVAVVVVSIVVITVVVMMSVAAAVTSIGFPSVQNSAISNSHHHRQNYHLKEETNYQPFRKNTHTFESHRKKPRFHVADLEIRLGLKRTLKKWLL